MRLADRIAQCRTPFIVKHTEDGSLTSLNNAAAFANDISRCATRYVLCDELLSLCTALAYSKGASTLDCADLLHVPAERVWVEWAEAPWRNELARYGFSSPVGAPGGGRRGVFIQSSPSGRRGLLRTFWADGDSELNVLSSSMEACFDFDVPEGANPNLFWPQQPSLICVSDQSVAKADLLQRCFRFRFEHSWQIYYDKARLSPAQTNVLLAFFLLLLTRPGLPRRPLMLERLNRARAKSGKPALLEQIEVFAPIVPEFRSVGAIASSTPRRSRRLHHVRGHLVRRGSKLFWRVPHLRGTARAGTVRTRTVTWQFDQAIPVPQMNGMESRPTPA
jgi:hypothetical protein